MAASVSVTLILAVRFPHHVLLNQGSISDGMAYPRGSRPLSIQRHHEHEQAITVLTTRSVRVAVYRRPASLKLK
jgi:hypothetical protein